MPILEKAYAKLDQNYDRIIAGNGAEGLRTLTGMPVIRYRTKPNQGMRDYALHKYWADKNYPMTASCCRYGGKYGLISGHAYSLLDVHELKNSAG